MLPFVAMVLSGCASGIDTPPHLRGYVFKYTTVPYTADLHDTPVSDSTGEGLGIRLKEPFSGYGVSAEYDANAIGDIARKHGMETIYFADREEFKILGVFRQRRLHIYGE